MAQKKTIRQRTMAGPQAVRTITAGLYKLMLSEVTPRQSEGNHHAEFGPQDHRHGLRRVAAWGRTIAWFKRELEQ